MNFEDEHYVRVYTRDSKTWLRWGWEGQALFMFLSRKVDKAGLLPDIENPIEDLALMTGLPDAVVEVGFPRLVRSGTVEVVGTTLVIPNYVSAQSVSKSDRLRAKESRAKRAATARASNLIPKQLVTERDEAVTAPEDEEEERELTDSDDPTPPRDGAVTERDGASRELPSASPNADQRRSTQIISTQRNAGGASDQPRPTGLDEALKIPIQARSSLLVSNWFEATYLQPQKWPEIQDFATRISAALGWHSPRLTSPMQQTLQKIVNLHAAFTPEELELAIEAAPKDQWLTEKAKGLGSLTIDVVSGLVNEAKRPRQATTRELIDGPGPASPEAEARRLRAEQLAIEETNRKLGITAESA